MPVSLDILDTRQFWNFYQEGSDDRLSDAFLMQYSDSTFNDEWDERDFDPLQLTFKCLNDYQFELEISLNSWCNELRFRNRTTDKLYQVGWWDLARWHPYGLQWHELIHLYNYWVDRPSKLAIHPDMAFLLLAKFVGVGSDEQDDLNDHEREIRAAYESLEFFTRSEINRLSKSTIVWPSEEDYVWKIDDRLGPVFGGEYPCYSIRNKAHAGCMNEDFPFDDFAVLMEKMAKRS